MIYKTHEIKWGRERIAYQIKAMLEHAELSIEQADLISACEYLPQSNKQTQNIAKVISILNNNWGTEELPTHDVRNLANKILDTAKSLKMSLPEISALLDAGKVQNSGAHPLNLSPFSTIIQYLFKLEKDKILAVLCDDKIQTKFVIVREVELPDGINRGELVNAIFL